MPDFKPVLYMKISCPWCLKLAAFLAEAGIWDDFEVRGFYEGDENEAAIRAELAQHYAKASFPTLQYEPGKYMIESGDIIDRYAAKLGLDPEKMSFYQYVLAGPLRANRERMVELMRLRKEVEESRVSA